MTNQREDVAAALADRYRVERELGAGGMATVYLARDLKHDRNVAIKVLHPELAASLGATRFVREVSIAANLSHPHILPLHDSGEAGPFLFYVMPYVEGESLRDRLVRDGRLSPAETSRILSQVGDALSYAHSRGIVHRDIKPENVMLTGRNAVVADFGIAKAVSEASATSTGKTNIVLTAVGVIIGTPAYMAPEQAVGDPNVDHRVDIYALGVMGYEMLTGNQPFQGNTPQEILTAQVTDAPKPISPDDAQSSPLVDVIAKSLEKTPADRWQSIDDMLPRLEAASVGSGSFFDRFGSRQILAASIGIAILVALLWALSTTVSRTGTSSSMDGSSVAVLPFADLSPEGDNEFFSDGLADELINSLSRIPDLRVAGRTSAFLFKNRRDDLQTIGDQLNVATVLDGSVRRAGSRIRVAAQLINVTDGFQVWSDSYDRELTDIFAVQEDLARSIVSALQLELIDEDIIISESRTDDVNAYNAYLLGRFHWNKRTAADLVTAAAHLERAIEADPAFAAAWSGLADTYLLFPPYGVETLPWDDTVGRAERAARRAIAIDSAYAAAHASLAAVLDAQWNWTEAAEEYARAIAANPRYPTARQWNALYLLAVDRVEEALTEIRVAEELDPLSPIIGTWVGLILDVAGQSAQASAQFERVVGLHPDFAPARRDAFLHNLRAGEFERASNHLDRYLDVTNSSFGSTWPSGLRNAETRIATLTEIATTLSDDFKMSTDVLVMLGNVEGALAALEERLATPRRLRDSGATVRAYVRSPEILEHPRFRALLEHMGLD